MSTKPSPLKTPTTTVRLCRICHNGPKSSLKGRESRSMSKEWSPPKDPDKPYLPYFPGFALQKSIDITLLEQN
ncbi:hypothetical protein VP1G_11250 [Cytospora mali]|uniref:Uncharacterized protein n=1 Tax=Cytospora mali TaxID=578113 RepID=A0A194VC55_CYTMA|nr:hypothetical protein VP1G_11250 [Valsa mali var. pyri (nom. inval.)]